MKFFEYNWTFPEYYVIESACIWLLSSLDDYNDKVAEMGLEDGEEIWSRNFIKEDEVTNILDMFEKMVDQSRVSQVIWRERQFFILSRALCYFIGHVDDYNNEMIANPPSWWGEDSIINVNEVKSIILKCSEPPKRS